jgi:hypothetical protein
MHTKHEGKRPMGKSKHKWEDNIRIRRCGVDSPGSG